MRKNLTCENERKDLWGKERTMQWKIQPRNNLKSVPWMAKWERKAGTRAQGILTAIRRWISTGTEKPRGVSQQGIDIAIINMETGRMRLEIKKFDIKQHTVSLWSILNLSVIIYHIIVNHKQLHIWNSFPDILPCFCFSFTWFQSIITAWASEIWLSQQCIFLPVPGGLL